MTGQLRTTTAKSLHGTSVRKVSTGAVRLAEFKSGTLASLRSLLPKDWTTQHEVAWSWLWDLVERQVQTNMGMPAKWERAYASFLDGIDEATGFNLRRDIYLTLPGACWTGLLQTIKHKLAPRFHEVLTVALDLYRDPVRMVDSISDVGLRHVGYGTPNIPHVSVPLHLDAEKPHLRHPQPTTKRFGPKSFDLWASKSIA